MGNIKTTVITRSVLINESIWLSGLNLECCLAGTEDSPPSNRSVSGGSGTGGSGGGSCGGGSNRGSRHKETKTTRVRTVLNEKQLHTLRTCYSANPRPDALMKEQLVEMTGLSPRVIRVWFQNKRCKDKKRNILMKQMQQQQQEKVRNSACIKVGMNVGQSLLCM